MPVPVIASLFADGLDVIPGARLVVTALPWLAVLYVLKWYFSGTSNTSERTMHGKVVMITVRFLVEIYKHESEDMMADGFPRVAHQA